MTEAPAEPPVRLGPAAANIARAVWHQKELLVLGLALGWLGLPKVLSSGSTYDATIRLQVLQPPTDAIMPLPPAVGPPPATTLAAPRPRSSRTSPSPTRWSTSSGRPGGSAPRTS